MKPERRYDIDWLRVLGMLTIFVFHCARYFDEGDWHVKNPVLYNEMSWLTGILSQWIMPLFFVLSAISACYSLGFRRGKEYMKERLKRLLVPFILGTFVLLIPYQVYVERVSHGQFEGSFFEFYPLYFRGFYGFGGNFAWMGLHLWYLEVLFVFSLLTLPLFLFFTGEKRKNLVQRLVTILNKPLTVYLLVVPFAAVEVLVSRDPGGIGMRAFGGWSVFTYLVIFILGFLLGLHTDILETLKRCRFISLFLAISALVVGIVLLESGYVYNGILMSGVRSLNTWCWLLTFLGFAARYLNFQNRFLSYANRAVLPFYIIHQTIIVAVGFLLLNWKAGLFSKGPVLVFLSFLVIIGLYDLLIRRFNWLSILFGMKRKSG